MTLHDLIVKIGSTHFDELVYQCDKHKIDLTPEQVLESLRFLEKQGLVKCELRVTDIKRLAGNP